MSRKGIMMTRSLTVEQGNQIVRAIRLAHDELRNEVLRFCRNHSLIFSSQPVRKEKSDTIYRIDASLDDLVPAVFEKHLGALFPFYLIGEGLPDDVWIARPNPRWRIPLRVIVDPIDGTRMLMFQKRSAWILTGVAVDRGENTGLKDIEVAVQTEIPVEKQHLAAQLWAIRSAGAEAVCWNRVEGIVYPLTFSPSSATTLAHQFVSFNRFFPGAKECIGRIEDRFFQHFGTHFFEDQYISAGGQIYELVVGHDVAVIDIRPLLKRNPARHSHGELLCAHPYDLCTELIARESGGIVTDEWGKPLNAPLDVNTDVSWIGYANQSIKSQVEPVLFHILEEMNLLTH